MNSILRWKIVLTVAVVVLGVYLALPSLPGVKGSAMDKFLPNDAINLGLDLKGGIFLTLEVDMDKAVETKLGRLAQELKDYAEERGVGFLNPKVLEDRSVEVNLHDTSHQDTFDALLEENFSVFTPTITPLSSGGVSYSLRVSQNYLDRFKQETMRQTVDIVRNRIDRRGVVEPDIRQQEGNRIQIQLPGMEDAEQAISVITQMGQLEFKIEASGVSVEQARNNPLEYEVAFVQDDPGAPIVLRKNPVLTGEYIADAAPNFDRNNRPYVLLELDGRGATIFEQVTAANVNKRLAIILDGKVYSAPVINERIGGGRASISGNFTVQKAKDLVTVLKDALPAPVEKVAESTIGPSLGQESIDKGINAAVIGLSLVIIFMVIYYGMAGVFADTVLLLNLVLIMAGLAAFGATLTLPGIAGIILTIGMAVDANVIIFERIREELRRGLTPKAAVQEGFGRATLTILDANVTTVIAAIILYQFGTGPIRGFAVTLTLGIITSMFTAIFVSRVFFDIYTRNKGSQAKISI
ncbi:preprotein translocase subunit SecD [Paucidesulfovibrio gracilis DSM 16080]|uniref:Protein translocase subunit SecD n=1 Tax=Paucidesulfovibrio gracilis DSM 16080 TaxID=1121449 RepID=A0A1T4WN77_9BACT|nr:protein translocase subunit SecD [Paucidesulfovibrio gracilis]SKA78669.1 preprotein translocase subunit SecD [Paucidesulfovibrio gracilis DSM 16080]